MKVLIAAMEVGETSGGKGRYPVCIMKSLVPELKARGCRVTILAAKDAPLDLFEPDARIVRLPVNKNTGMWRAVWEEIYLPLHAWGADVFIVMNGMLPLAPVRSKRKIVVSYDIHPLQHLADPQKFPGQYSRKSLLRTSFEMRKAVQSADRIVTISQSAAEEIHSFLGIPRDRMVNIPCGVDHDFFSPQSSERVEKLRKRYGLPEEFYLFLGYPDPSPGNKKNLHLIVEAYSQAHDNEKHLLPVVLAGGEHAGFRREPEQVPIGGSGPHKFLYLGFCPDEDLPALYTAARALIFPSLHEGFGIPPLEAMACGTPVIASNRPAIPEVVGDAALLIDPLQPQSLLAALGKVAEEPVRRELIAKGFERARLFSWERSADLMLRLIQGEKTAALMPNRKEARP
ncbi:MAG: glycosyltransferase family 1 protein [Terriglobia bacterium]|jgi:glycosyltransferase involved in cell wall biosynthesis